jgi:hypothetical protein
VRREMTIGVGAPRSHSGRVGAGRVRVGRPRRAVGGEVRVGSEAAREALGRRAP